MLKLNSTPVLFAVVLSTLLLAACGKSAPEAPTTKAATSAVTTTSKPAAKVASTKPATATTAPIPAPAPAPAPVPAPAATAFSVSAVTLGSAVDDAHQVTQPTTHFAQTDKTIYASVVSTGHTPHATLSARWKYLQGAGMVISNVSQQLAADGPATTTFTLENPDLWPEGKYNVEISVDGIVVNTQAFTISK